MATVKFVYETILQHQKRSKIILAIDLDDIGVFTYVIYKVRKELIRMFFSQKIFKTDADLRPTLQSIPTKKSLDDIDIKLVKLRSEIDAYKEKNIR